MSQLDAIITRARGLPRPMQWALLAGIGLVLFLFWDTSIRPLADTWNAQADAIEADIERVRHGERTAKWMLGETSPAVSFGPVTAPSPDDAGRTALNRTVTDILQSYESKVTSADFKLRPRGKLKAGVLPRAAGGRRVERITGELRFTARPEDAAAILADFESHPDIESVTEVLLLNPTNSRVDVHLTLEVWVLASAGSTV